VHQCRAIAEMRVFSGVIKALTAHVRMNEDGELSCPEKYERPCKIPKNAPKEWYLG